MQLRKGRDLNKLSSWAAGPNFCLEAIGLFTEFGNARWKLIGIDDINGAIARIAAGVMYPSRYDVSHAAVVHMAKACLYQGQQPSSPVTQGSWALQRAD